MKKDEGVLARGATKGPPLYFHAAMPDDSPVAAVAVLHGYADHGARYAHVMEAWAKRGIASVAIDMRGHGRAEGRRGYCSRFDEFLMDVDEAHRLVRERAPDVPLFLFGHSFGGLVASLHAIAHPEPWRGLVLTDPFFGLALAVPAVKIFAGKIASRIVPALGLPSGLTGAGMTHDAKVAKAYDEDPLVFRNATARWFTETQAAQAQAFASAPSLTMPLYVVFGTGDRIAKLESARTFFDAAGSKDKHFDAREGLLHEVMSEPEWPSVAGALADWMIAHE
jgi:alpha-beta hydrolase superfamily lysophospholipase